MKRYTKKHECVWIEGDYALVGISQHAADELGDITFVELPEIDTDLIVGETLGVVESVKAASDIYSPISGTVKEVNEKLEDTPGIVNSSPEADGWICKLDNYDIAEMDELMDEEAYISFINQS
jgi:glycine cleavage system H protein